MVLGNCVAERLQFLLPEYPGFDIYGGRVLHAHDFRDAREFAEGRALLRLFDMRFERHRPLGLGEADGLGAVKPRRLVCS